MTAILRVAAMLLVLALLGCDGDGDRVLRDENSKLRDENRELRNEVELQEGKIIEQHAALQVCTDERLDQFKDQGERFLSRLENDLTVDSRKRKRK